MSKGNFKARCIHKNNNPYYTEGKVYEVKDRTLIADDGHKIFTGLLWRFEDLQKFSGAEWELVKEYSGEYISIKRRKKRVVAVMSVDGQYKKSANVKLNDFDGDFEKAAKAVVGKLLENKEDAPLTASTIDWEAFKQGKFAVHCDTEEKAKAFLKECDEQGIRWCSGHEASSLINWKYYRENTYYRFYVYSDGEVDKGIAYGNLSSGCPVEVINYAPSKPAVKAPEPKPYRIVKQDKYEVGDKVKVREDLREGMGIPYGITGRMEKLAGSFVTIKKVLSDSYHIEEEDYIWHPDCFEGKVIKNIPDQPAIKEVKRPAKVGEWIRVIQSPYSAVNDGEIKKVEVIYYDNVVGVKGNIKAAGDGFWAIDEYVVLENYQPEPSSLDSNSKPEQPTSSTGMREVKREAKPGDFVKIVNANNTLGNYKNGDVLKIISTTDTSTFPYYKDKLGCFLFDDEYVVLENYDYSYGHPKNEPFCKAKVGDKIKVVRIAGNHTPEIKIGDIHTITSITSWSVHTDKRNAFHDTDEEYIIIEEAPEAIEIGDTVKVIDSGRTCSTHSRFIEENAKNFFPKYKDGYAPKNGDTGVVVGRGKHRIYSGDFYAVLSNNKVFCISGKGIEKVK